MAITRFILPLTFALFLPLAAAAQTMAPAAPADGCCGAMHQMPATGAAVDHSAHQAPEAAKPAVPPVPGMKADAAGCCGAAKAGDQPKATMECCAGMKADSGKDATDAKPCEHCAAKPAAKPADKPADAPAPGCCDDMAAGGCCAA